MKAGNRRRKGIGFSRILLFPLVIGLALFPGTGRAAAVADQICSPAGTGVVSFSLADYDKDGFTDYEECAGLSMSSRDLENGLQSYAQFGYPGYSAYISGGGTLPRNEYLDPETPDIFVIMESSIQNVTNPLEYLGGGLNLAIHVIALAGPDREVTYLVGGTGTTIAHQSALNIQDNTSGATQYDDALGAGIQGTPGTASYARVYTTRIDSHVANICAASTAAACRDSSGVTGAPNIATRYKKHTIAHEAGHNVSLAPVSVDRYGGYHYAAGSGTVMEQSVKYTSKGGKVVFYISTTYTGTDPASKKLVP